MAFAKKSALLFAHFKSQVIINDFLQEKLLNLIAEEKCSRLYWCKAAFNLSTIKLTHRDRFAVFIVYLILLYLCLMITAGHCKGIGKGH